MPKGTCRYCVCTTDKPCRYVPNPHNAIGGQKVLACTGPRSAFPLVLATVCRSLWRNRTNSSEDSADNCSRRVFAVSKSLAISSHSNFPLRSFFRISNQFPMLHPPTLHPHVHSWNHTSPWTFRKLPSEGGKMEGTCPQEYFTSD
jgi:hypothetical protein